MSPLMSTKYLSSDSWLNTTSLLMGPPYAAARANPSLSRSGPLRSSFTSAFSSHSIADVRGGPATHRSTTPLSAFEEQGSVEDEVHMKRRLFIDADTP